MKRLIGATIAALARVLLPLYFALFKKTRRGRIDLGGVKPPFLLISNHQATMDPFYLGVHLPGVTNYVATDMLFRLPIMNYLMSAIGSIPKSKFVSDAASVRLMLQKVRHGQSVGIFPEGQRCVAGFTDRIIPGIGKLSKMLNVPVVVGRLEGGFLADPRWAIKKRKGGSTVSIRLLFTKGQLKSMDPEKIEEAIKASLQHSDYDWIKAHPEFKYPGKNRALGLHNVMFICPECGAWDSFNTEGDLASCRKCGYCVSWGDRGEFILVKGMRLHHENLQQQELWQRAKMDSVFAGHISSKPKGSPIYGPQDIIIRRSHKSKPLMVIGQGKLTLCDDRLVLETDADCPSEFQLCDIEGFTISAIKGKHHRIVEFMYKKKALYNFVFQDQFESTYKWNLMVDRFKAAQDAKTGLNAGI